YTYTKSIEEPNHDGVRNETIDIKDAFGRSRWTIHNSAGVAREIAYQYDTSGNLISIKDPLNTEETFEYDTWNRRTASHSPHNGDQTYVYDLFGNLLTSTDAKGQVTKMEYDADGRLKYKTF